MKVPRRHLLVSSVALLAVLAACSSSSDDGRAHPTKATTSPRAKDVDRTSPLQAFLGPGTVQTTTSDETEDRRLEEMTARCMAKQGFAYVPHIVSITTTQNADGTGIVKLNGPTLPDLPPAEFAERYGYGFTTVPPRDDKEDVDPNEAIVKKMSVAERVAYYHALDGDAVHLDSQGNPSGNERGESEDSCSGKSNTAGLAADAQRDSSEKRVTRVQTTYTSLLDRIKDLYDSQLADPRMKAATATWSGCMTAAGFPGFDDLQQPQAKIGDEAHALLGPDLDATDVDQAKLVALRQREISMAVADNACKGPWDTTLVGVRHDLETAFVRRNRAELTSYRSAMAAAISQR